MEIGEGLEKGELKVDMSVGGCWIVTEGSSRVAAQQGNVLACVTVTLPRCVLWGRIDWI